MNKAECTECFGAGEVEVTSLGDWIRYRQKQLRLIHPTLRDIAKDTGVSASTISRVMNGGAYDLGTLERLARWCHLKPDHYYELLTTAAKEAEAQEEQHEH